MAIKLNQSAVEYAKKLIKAGEVERGEQWNWQEDQATPDEIVKFLNAHSTKEYGLWFLGIDTDYPENNKDRYEFPHGDLKVVYKNALVAAKKEASKQGLKEIEEAADRLIAFIQTTK